jgi:tripartite-type tricarboxylate transporter receptor subunit TctC
MARQPIVVRFARAFGLLLLGLALVQAAASPSRAEDYPSRPVKIIVPAAPGGALDTISRLLAQRVSQLSHQQFFIENKPGANWIVGMDAAAKSAPDGYTLLFIADSGLTVIPFVSPHMPLDPLKDLEPISAVTTAPFVLLANPNLPVKSVADLVAYARTHPGKLNHASNSATTILVSELFKQQAKIDYVDINFHGASEAIAATQAGTTQICFVDLGSATSAIESKTLRPLALTSPQRYPLAPDIPTFVEAELPNVAATSTTLMMAPRNVPRDIVKTLGIKFRAALNTPEVAARLRSIGQVVDDAAAEQTAKELAGEAHEWQTLIKERDIQFGK